MSRDLPKESIDCMFTGMFGIPVPTEEDGPTWELYSHLLAEGRKRWDKMIIDAFEKVTKDKP